MTAFDDSTQQVLFYIAGVAYLDRHQEFKLPIGGIIDEKCLHDTFQRYATIASWMSTSWADPDNFPATGGRIPAVSAAIAQIKHMKTECGRVSMMVREDGFNRLYLESLPQSFIGRHFTLTSPEEVRKFAHVVRLYYGCMACFEAMAKDAFRSAMCAIHQAEQTPA